jgi:type II secretory pathway pseudopilin PulG
MGNKGFTIVEMTVSTFIVGVATLALSTIMVWAVVEFEAIKRRLMAQTESLKAEVLLRRYVGQAVQVGEEAGTPLANSGNVNLNSWGWEGGGRFAADFNYDELGDWPGAWQNVGVFLREWRWKTETGGTVNDLRSDLWPTGIFLRRPEAPGTDTMGVLFFDPGIDGSGNPDPTVSPDYGDQWVGGIVEFAMQKKMFTNAPAEGGLNINRVISILFTYKIRYHFSGSKSRNWCPTLDIANSVCPRSATGYMDILKSVRVVLPNNRLNTRNIGTPMWEWDRALGPIYFFRPVFPRVREN